MTEKTMPQALSELDKAIAYVTGEDETLKELSRLHVNYEQLANDYGYYSNDAVDAAAELSAAVGRFLAGHGYEAIV